jgi:hypothetical protein
VHLVVATCLRYDLRLRIQLNSDPGGQQQSARAATIDSKPIQQYVDGGGIQNHKVSRQGDTTFMLVTAYSTQSLKTCSAALQSSRAQHRLTAAAMLGRASDFPLLLHASTEAP